MSYKNIVNKIFDEGKKTYEDMECYIESSHELELSIFDGEVDEYQLSETEGLSFRGIVDGNMGYSYTEKIDESSIDMLIEGAKENAKYNDSQDKEIIYGGSEIYQEFNKEKANLNSMSLDGKIEFLKKLEQAAYDFSDEISSVNYCLYGESTDRIYIENTKDLRLDEENSLAYVQLSVVAKLNDDIKTGSATRISRNLDDLNYKEIASEACRDAISMLGADTVDSGKYNIIIHNKTFSSLLKAFISVFVAENIQNNMSLMKDRLGDKVATSKFTLREDPHMYNGFRSRTFDDEGTATKKKSIIEEGILKNYFYNWKAANKDKIDSTGNGFRNSYKGGTGIDYTNLVVEPGEKDFKELLNTLGDGLFITSLQGLHSGLNAVSGDYSLSASGYEIKEGKIFKPVNQITIAGNLVDLLNNIEDVAGDIDMSFERISTPSILVKDVSVSGK